MNAGWFKKLTVAGPATFKSSVTATTGTATSKTIVATSSVTASKGLVEGVETKTHPGALATYGVSLIDGTTAGTSFAYTLGPPGAAGIGQVKTVIWAANALSTRVITVATTATLYNSSAKTFATVTGKTRLLNAPPYCRLVGATATKWAVTGVNLSSAMTLA